MQYLDVPRKMLKTSTNENQSYNVYNYFQLIDAKRWRIFSRSALTFDSKDDGRGIEDHKHRAPFLPPSPFGPTPSACRRILSSIDGGKAKISFGDVKGYLKVY